MTRLLVPILILLLTGCQRTRSFLHLDSNNPSPFLGLELSVDAKSSRPNRATQPLFSGSQADVVSLSEDFRSDSVPGIQRVRAVPSNADRPQQRYVLPLVDLDTDPERAAEVEDIMSRMAGG